MAKQFSGSNAKISYKPEKDNGVLVTTRAKHTLSLIHMSEPTRP